MTYFSCDQYLIILILLAAQACLLSYLSAYAGMPALSFLLAVYFLQSVSGWRHLDVDQRRCRDRKARASDPTRFPPMALAGSAGASHAKSYSTFNGTCKDREDTMHPAGLRKTLNPAEDYQFKFFLKRGNSCSSAATCLCSCNGNTLHTCTQMNTNRIIEITVTPFYTKTRHLGSFLKNKNKTCTS